MKKRLYVEMLVIFSMIILCCSVKEIYADDNMDVVCEEKVDTKENIVDGNTLKSNTNRLVCKKWGKKGIKAIL